jgi:hypothetical protein
VNYCLVDVVFAVGNFVVVVYAGGEAQRVAGVGCVFYSERCKGQGNVLLFRPLEMVFP